LNRFDIKIDLLGISILNIRRLLEKAIKDLACGISGKSSGKKRFRYRNIPMITRLRLICISSWLLFRHVEDSIKVCLIFYTDATDNAKKASKIYR
jgi:hypothetical protein